ncbi:hypothetical protein EJB05_38989 [Eragrostis curvula]|uniref:Uncharacterized protein n=1 Tax=Eragrostis curvula TaxID=38414 RepID=A0A5J9TWA9_9POAL|nr:hypothetical protein EJB05_38989 [Eragrostis curvula]
MQSLAPYTGVMNLEGLRRPLLAVQIDSTPKKAGYRFGVDEKNREAILAMTGNYLGIKCCT